MEEAILLQGGEAFVCVCVCLHCMSICLSASDFYSIKPVACAIGTRVIIWQNTWL